jgi:hypothetical protein
VLCLIAVPLTPVKNPSAVKIIMMMIIIMIMTIIIINSNFMFLNIRQDENRVLK